MKELVQKREVGCKNKERKSKQKAEKKKRKLVHA